jgi:hypothetical protein
MGAEGRPLKDADIRFDKKADESRWLQFQTDVCVAANNAFTDSRESTMIVNTPRIVPKGMKRHSTHAIVNANQ